MLHGRLSSMLGARSILDSVTPSCEGRPPAGPRGPLPHLRVHQTPGFPCALWSSGAKDPCTTRAYMRRGTGLGHCEEPKRRLLFARCASYAGRASAEAPLREGGSNPDFGYGKVWIA